MTFTLFVLLGAIATLAVAWLLARKITGFRPASVTDLEALFYKGPDVYASIGRILGPQDFDFLAAARCGGPFVARLRRQRVALMKVMLGQMREEFESLLTIGALFATAPTAQAENFAGLLQRNRIRFYRNLGRLYLRTWVNRFVLWPIEVLPLNGEIQEMRREADRILHALTPGDLGVLRTHLRAL